MKKTGLFVLLFLCASVAQADLYEARLADGSVSYSDRASPDSQRQNKSITNPMTADQMPGIWTASDFDGGKAELTLSVTQLMKLKVDLEDALANENAKARVLAVAARIGQLGRGARKHAEEK